MKDTKSFFKREAIFTLLFQLAIPAFGILVVGLIILLRRWLAH